MDLKKLFEERDKELSSRPIPERAGKIENYHSLLPDEKFLGDGWRILETHQTDEKIMARLNRVEVSRMYDHPKIPSRPSTGDPDHSLKVSILIFDGSDGPLETVAQFIEDFDHNRNIGDWCNGYFSTLWKGCVAYPRSPSDFNDVIVQFCHDDCLWTVHSESHYALWIAASLHSRLTGQDPPDECFNRLVTG